MISSVHGTLFNQRNCLFSLTNESVYQEIIVKKKQKKLVSVSKTKHYAFSKLGLNFCSIGTIMCYKHCL